MDKLIMVEDGTDMKDDFANSDILKKDLKKIVGDVTPYLPYIGLITGDIIVARHVWSAKKDVETFEDEQAPNASDD